MSYESRVQVVLNVLAHWEDETYLELAPLIIDALNTEPPQQRGTSSYGRMYGRE